jgi:uncharacterized protein
MAISWVVKVSKFCNLRCKYCYEWPYLDKRDMLSLDNWRKLIHSAFDYHIEVADACGSENVTYFIWHGGEPLLMPAWYFHQVLAIQRQILGVHVGSFRNAIQTNLYQLTDEKLEIIKQYGIGVGVSYDVFPGVRVTAGGKNTEEKVLSNMQKLRDADVPFNCISVLGAHTGPKSRFLYDFFSKNEISFRALALKAGPYEKDNPSTFFTNEGIVAGLFNIFISKMEGVNHVSVDPIDGYSQAVLLKMAGLTRCKFSRAEYGDKVIIVDVDGKLYLRRDAYSKSFGDLNVNSIYKIRKMEPYRESVREDLRRSSEICEKCEYYGACDGFPILEAGLESEVTSCNIAYPVMKLMEDYYARIGVNKDYLHSEMKDYIVALGEVDCDDGAPMV